jgi:hypothetical protein
MRRQPRSRGQTRVANLLAMASTASAMSLSNFQLITSSQVPLGCILAYNAPIRGCSNAADFTQGPEGNTCSAGCKGALQNVADALTTVCGDANVPSGSVLGQALSGGLVGLLCPSGKTSTTAPAPPQNVGHSSTVAIVITQTTRQIGTFSQIPTPTTLRRSTTTSSSSSSSSSDDGDGDDDPDPETESQTSTSSADPEPPHPTEITQTTQVAPVPVVASSVGARPTQTTSAQQTKTPPQAAPNNRPGAASPFDIAAVASGSQRLMVRWLEGFLFANAFVFILLR